MPFAFCPQESRDSGCFSPQDWSPLNGSKWEQVSFPHVCYLTLKACTCSFSAPPDYFIKCTAPTSTHSLYAGLCIIYACVSVCMYSTWLCLCACGCVQAGLCVPLWAWMETIFSSAPLFSACSLLLSCSLSSYSLFFPPLIAPSGLLCNGGMRNTLPVCLMLPITANHCWRVLFSLCGHGLISVLGQRKTGTLNFFWYSAFVVLHWDV